MGGFVGMAIDDFALARYPPPEGCPGVGWASAGVTASRPTDQPAD